MMTRKAEIYNALNNLMAACGLNGESGTEILASALRDSLDDMELWAIVKDSHREGLFYDVNHLLAEALDRRISEEL
jgi:hypothetical protein